MSEEIDLSSFEMSMVIRQMKEDDIEKILKCKKYVSLGWSHGKRSN